MKFTLSIEIGNDAMSEKEHLADALRRVATRLDSYHKDYLDENFDLPFIRGITDINGNTVGEWRIEE